MSTIVLMELVENSNTLVKPVVEPNLNSGQRIDLCDRTFECELNADVLHVVSAKKCGNDCQDWKENWEGLVIAPPPSRKIEESVIVCNTSL